MRQRAFTNAARADKRADEPFANAPRVQQRPRRAFMNVLLGQK
jgi:hypothetical protein